MWRYTSTDELYHHGIKGMKWGIRRYQNKDGTLTDAGKRRAARDMSELNNNKKKHYSPNADKWVKEDLSRSKKLTDETKHMTNEIKRINDAKIKNRPKVKMDLSNMSDKEMRDKINRAFLEKQYNDMFGQQEVSRGRERATQILETTGNILAVGSSALGIALAIKELRG